MDYLDRSLKSQLRQADRLKAKFVLILKNQGGVVLRDMEKGIQKEMSIEEAMEELTK